MNMHTANSTNSRVDQLGKRTIEGLECTGVKTTMTLAGARRVRFDIAERCGDGGVVRLPDGPRHLR